MPIETAFDVITDLNSSYPAGNDYRKDGDNHIRGIKSVLLATFPGWDGPVTASPDDLSVCEGLAADPINAINSGGVIPSGIICMWGGLNSAIPAGWLLCDGTNGTPDLSDRFILGTILNDKGPLGDSHTATSSEMGSHDHGGATGATTLTTDQIPSHTHTYGSYTIDDVAGGSAVNVPFGDLPTTGTSGATGGGESHTHTITSGGAHTHTVSLLGKRYLLAFIQKA